MKPTQRVLLPLFFSLAGTAFSETVDTEVVVYGGTPAGVTAAIAAAREGHPVSLIDINNHIGGMMSGGLVETDIGDRKTVGGLSDDYFKRVTNYYLTKYGKDSIQFKECHDGVKFEPRVAEAILGEMIAEHPSIRIWSGHRYRSVAMENGRIASVTMDDTNAKTTRTFTGKIFIDASYEGDVMAGAGVPYRVGREGRAEFGEFLAGTNMGAKQHRGLGDHRTQAYNYRVSITSNTANRVLFPKPEQYDPEPWRISFGKRVLTQGIKDFGGLYVNVIIKVGPNEKFDTNWCDVPGGSEGYAEGSWETRDRIAARHRDYFLSLLYYLQNDPELPESFRTETMKWGLPKDEFTDNGHFPFQLYVREGRRMLGRYILREQDLTTNRWKPDGIATGSYGIDCHFVQSLLHNGQPVVERTRHISVDNYDIPYATITPIEPDNLLVPLCISATHVAYASLRMEPVYMMLGEAAGSAAHLALSGKTSVQEVDVARLRKLLADKGGILDAGYQPQVEISWSPAHPRQGEAVKFSVKSNDLKSPLKNIWWDFNGNGVVGATGETAEHSFPLEKHHNVCLLVEDEAGNRRLVSAEVPVGASSVKDLTVDEFDGEMIGRWTGTYPDVPTPSGTRVPDIHYGPGIHRDAVIRGEKSPVRASIKPEGLKPGRYQVCVGFRPLKTQATNTPVTINFSGGKKKLALDQRNEQTPFNFVSVGEYAFSGDENEGVEITNSGADGLIAIDGVRWIWLGD